MHEQYISQSALRIGLFNSWDQVIEVRVRVRVRVRIRVRDQVIEVPKPAIGGLAVQHAPAHQNSGRFSNSREKMGDRDLSIPPGESSFAPKNIWEFFTLLHGKSSRRANWVHMRKITLSKHAMNTNLKHKSYAAWERRPGK